MKHQPSTVRSRQFPFYKTYIDIQCRKDILVENEHVNKNVKAKMTPFLRKFQTKAKENKFRLIYFFGFIVLFKMEPVYDYFFCDNKAVNWIYNNLIHYYTDYTNPIPQSALQTSRESKLVEKSSQNKKLAELFYKIDKHPNIVIGYNPQTDSFVNNKQYEISFEQYLQLCKNKHGLNFGEIELKMKNSFIDCLI